MQFCEIIKAAREARGLTQAEAARACDVDRRRWHEWESGRARPETLTAILAGLGVSDASEEWAALMRAYAGAA